MKKNLLVTLLHVCFTIVCTYGMNVNAYTVNSDMCGLNLGAVYAEATGGAQPYTYQWSTGATTDSVFNLPGGMYTVTVTDAGGTSMTASTIVASNLIPDLNAGAIGMPAHGMNNGFIDFFLYSFGMSVPAGTYTFNLVDSVGNNYFNQVTNCTCNLSFGVLNYSVRNLPPGSYHLTVNTIQGCSAYLDFVLHELPAIAPTFVTTPSCNGSPTGIISINLHPQPALDANSLSIYTDIESHPPAGYSPSQTTYRAIIKNSLGQNINQSTGIADSVQVRNDLPPDNYTLEIKEGDVNYTFADLLYSFPFTIATDTSCALVTGKLFADYNSDCVYNNPDLSLDAATIQLTPGPYYGVTNSSGEFFIPVVPGNYTMQQFSSFPHIQKCPDPATYQLTIAQGQIVTVNIADSVTGQPDVLAGLTSYTQPRPGFSEHYRVTYKNISPFYATPTTVTLTYDPGLVFNNSYPTPTTSAAGQLKWNVDSLAPFSQAVFDIYTTVPVATPLGTVLNAVASVTGVTNEIALSNNSDSISQSVTGSFDPNLKEVSPVGGGAQGYITNTELLEYTIHFQNTGNDTAFFVTVYDTLPVGLDITTLQMLNASHDYSYELKAGNVAIFHFDNILLADSNTNEEASHGMFKFSVEQKPGNTSGTVLSNTAAIVFDFNLPVITNAVVNTIYECNQLATASISSQVICEGDSITASSTVLFPVNSEWELDGISISNAPSVVLSNAPGTYSLSFMANSEGCAVTIPFTITVNTLPSKPVISAAGNNLTSSALTGNQWFYNNLLLPGAIQQNYYANQAGWYKVMVTDGNGCANTSDSVYITPVSVNEYLLGDQISIQPNPAKSFITVSVNDQNKGNAELVLKDMTGKIILMTHLTSGKNRIELNNIAKGVYLIEVICDGEKGYCKLLRE